MPPSYPARDFDPRLTKHAQSLSPLIHALNSYIQTTGSAPYSLDRLPKSVKVPEGVHYEPKQTHYRILLKLGWDPALWYDSQSRSWTFEPGDGRPEKVIKLQVEPIAGGNVR